MQIVNAIRQYAAIIEHCPDIIRAIVSIQADAFDCATLHCTEHYVQPDVPPAIALAIISI